MLVDPSTFALFLMATLAVCIAPGPDMLYVLANGIHQGPRAGIVSAFGMAAGMLVHTAAATLGLATLFAASPLSFAVVRYGGAAYLFWIGVKALREPVFSGNLQQGERSPLRLVFQRAMLTNLLNPKIVLFYVAFLPQFVRPERGSTTLQFLSLGITFVILGLLVDSAIGALSGTFNTLLTRSLRVSRMLSWISALIFIGLSVRLLIT